MRAMWTFPVLLLIATIATAQDGVEAQAEYKLVVGDTIEVTVVDQPDYSRQFDVPGGGRVRYPQIGYVELVGRRLADLAEEIERKFADSKILKKPTVSVVVISYAPRVVYLTGAQYAAVPLPVHKPMTLLQVIATAGGWGNGDKRNVRIIRKDAKGELYPIPINAEEILQKEQWDKNIVIMPEDMIYIPPFAPLEEQQWVYVLGHVRSAGPQPLMRGRQKITLAKLVSIVGGFTQYARTGDIRIIRKTGNRPRIIHIDFDDIIDGERDDVVLEPDDLIFIPESIF